MRLFFEDFCHSLSLTLSKTVISRFSRNSRQDGSRDKSISARDTCIGLKELNTKGEKAIYLQRTGRGELLAAEYLGGAHEAMKSCNPLAASNDFVPHGAQRRIRCLWARPKEQEQM